MRRGSLASQAEASGTPTQRAGWGVGGRADGSASTRELRGITRHLPASAPARRLARRTAARTVCWRRAGAPAGWSRRTGMRAAAPSTQGSSGFALRADISGVGSDSVARPAAERRGVELLLDHCASVERLVEPQPAQRRPRRKHRKSGSRIRLAPTSPSSCCGRSCVASASPLACDFVPSPFPAATEEVPSAPG